MENPQQRPTVSRPRRAAYEIVAKAPAEDERLSFAAKGLYLYLITRPDDWRVYVRQLCTVGPDGETATRSALGELLKVGLVERQRVRGEGGQFCRWEYRIADPANPHDALGMAYLRSRGGPPPPVDNPPPPPPPPPPPVDNPPATSRKSTRGEVTTRGFTTCGFPTCGESRTTNYSNTPITEINKYNIGDNFEKLDMGATGTAQEAGRADAGAAALTDAASGYPALRRVETTGADIPARQRTRTGTGASAQESAPPFADAPSLEAVLTLFAELAPSAPQETRERWGRAFVRKLGDRAPQGTWEALARGYVTRCLGSAGPDTEGSAGAQEQGSSSKRYYPTVYANHREALAAWVANGQKGTLSDFVAVEAWNGICWVEIERGAHVPDGLQVRFVRRTTPKAA